MQLEVAQLQQLYTLMGFLDDTGPVGWEKLREFEDDLPDVDIEQRNFSNVYTFRDGDEPIGQLVSTYIMFGMSKLDGEWEQGFNKFVDKVNGALTSLQLELQNSGLLTDEDLAELSQDASQL